MIDLINECVTAAEDRTLTQHSVSCRAGTTPQHTHTHWVSMLALSHTHIHDTQLAAVSMLASPPPHTYMTHRLAAAVSRYLGTIVLAC